MNTHNSLLDAANKIEASLLFSETSKDYNRLEQRLLGFCIHRLGMPPREIYSAEKSAIDEWLNINNIHYRRIECPRDLPATEYPLILFYTPDSDLPKALYRKGRRNWIYCAETDRHFKATRSLKTTSDAFELYASLPAKVKGPLSVLSFAFGNELAASISLLVASGSVMLFNLSIPMLTSLLVSRILPHNDQKLLLEGLAVVILIVIGSVFAQYLQTRMMLRLESVADLRLQTAVWDRLLKLPMSLLSNYTTADLASRVNSINQIRQLLGSGVLSSLLSSLFALSYFSLMYYYDANLAVWSTVFTFLSVVLIAFLIKKSVSLQMPLLESGADMTNFALQSVMGLPQIRSAGGEPYIFLEWLKRVSDNAVIQLKNNWYSDSLEQYSILVGPISSLFIFSVLVIRLLGSTDGVETTSIIVAFISFNAAFSAFNTSISNATNLIANTFGKASVLWQRAEPILYADVEPGYDENSIQHNLQGRFTLRDISYTYPGKSDPIFEDLSIDIPSGIQTAITGPSGCGKTTIVRMLLGFVEPMSGHILVDGIPISQLAIRNYRRQLGVVMQTARLNSGSIYDIVCGGMQYSEDQVWDALDKASVGQEVRQMPMKLETLLSDSGGNISGGQVQRIAIARALITSPKVLIMDEATSALDNKSQQAITDVVKNLGITRITIAHRLSTIKAADNIIILNGKNPPDQGTWSEVQGTTYIRKMLKSE